MAGVSPTENTLKELRKRGYRAAVVERWNPHARIRHDLFGFVDVLAVGPDGTIAVQATSYSNISARVRKITEECLEALTDVREAGWTVEVWGWRKVGNRWTLKAVDIS